MASGLRTRIVHVICRVHVRAEHQSVTGPLPVSIQLHLHDNEVTASIPGWNDYDNCQFIRKIHDSTEVQRWRANRCPQSDAATRRVAAANATDHNVDRPRQLAAGSTGSDMPHHAETDYQSKHSCGMAARRQSVQRNWIVHIYCTQGQVGSGAHSAIHEDRAPSTCGEQNSEESQHPHSKGAGCI